LSYKNSTKIAEICDHFVEKKNAKSHAVLGKKAFSINLRCSFSKKLNTCINIEFKFYNKCKKFIIFL